MDWKQVTRQWNKNFDSFMLSQGYKRTNADHCVYTHQFPGGKSIILLLYFNCILIVVQDTSMIRRLKEELSKSFDIKDLGPANQILGMQNPRSCGCHTRGMLNKCLRGST